MILVTGGLGFIGTNLVKFLKEQKHNEIIICDKNKTPRFVDDKNLDIIEFANIFEFLNQNKKYITAIVHLGAITDTTEKDVDLILKNNYFFSLDLWNFAKQNNIKFVYASSAATYGNGSLGFDDSLELSNLSKLRPLNPYGWSKHLYDIKIIRECLYKNQSPECWAGLKFFNVYGPYEDNKGSQSSVAHQMINKIKSGLPITLFRSHNVKYKDGEQMRDFIYVEDCVKVIDWILKQDKFSGLYNVGSGVARKFIDLATSICASIGVDPNIKWIDTPSNIRSQYQYFTEAKIDKLVGCGYKKNFYSIEEGIIKFIKVSM